MEISIFGQKIASTSGIGRLMDDLGNAMSQGGETIMLGGGNPAHIPQVQRYFRQLAIMIRRRVMSNLSKQCHNCCEKNMAGALRKKILL
jgi:alanine-alpha-ketoisovalerate/valine-pyruvate aminotransferase